MSGLAQFPRTLSLGDKPLNGYEVIYTYAKPVGTPYMHY